MLQLGLHLDSSDISEWLDKGRFLKIATKHDEAIKCFDVVLSMDPKFKEAIFLKAGCYLFLDELDKSFKYCNDALELDGGSSSLKSDENFNNLVKKVIFNEKIFRGLSNK